MSLLFPDFILFFTCPRSCIPSFDYETMKWNFFFLFKYKSLLEICEFVFKGREKGFYPN